MPFLTRLRPVLGSVALLALAGVRQHGSGRPAGEGPCPALGRGATGLAGGEVEGVMGEPTLIRADGHAQYWRYGLGGCQLDLFLYADQPRAGPASPISTCGRRAAPTADHARRAAPIWRRLCARSRWRRTRRLCRPAVSQPF